MTEIDLGLGILDHQIIDCTGRRCGKVDDVVLDLEAPGGPQVAAILSGADARRARSRLGRLTAGCNAGPTAQVPWDAVVRVQAGVELAGKAAEYGLGLGDDELTPFLDKIPGSRL